MTHNKIDTKFVTGKEIGDPSITSNQTVWVKNLIKCRIVSSAFHTCALQLVYKKVAAAGINVLRKRDEKKTPRIQGNKPF